MTGEIGRVGRTQAREGAGADPGGDHRQAGRAAAFRVDGDPRAREGAGASSQRRRSRLGHGGLRVSDPVDEEG